MKVEMQCHCGTIYSAREADLRRGWGLSCDKHCAAIRRDYGRPKAKRVDGGVPVSQTKAKPSSLRRRDLHREDVEVDYEGGGWDSHKLSI